MEGPVGTASVDDLLSVEDLRIAAPAAGGGSRSIVSGVTFSVARGESLAIVGESGSGKTVTARSLVGLLPEGLTVCGTASFGGSDLLSLTPKRMLGVRGRGISLLMQDPNSMLNPVARVATQVSDGLRLAHPEWSKHRTREDVLARLAEAGIEDESVADRRVFELSGGMKQRVALAAALARDPSLLIADEPTSALDVVTQRAVLATLREIQRRRGMSMIFVSHDLRIAFSTCDRVAVFYAGQVVEMGPTSTVDQRPAHPYTVGLLSSEPDPARRMRLAGIPGRVPRAHDVLSCCPFTARCGYATTECMSGRPPLEPVSSDHATACVRLPEIRAALDEARTRAVMPDDDLAVPVAGAKPVCAVSRAVRVFETSGVLRPRRSVVAVDDVSFVVHPGESVGLVGESGSGKTTIARCLVGLERLTSGTVTVDGIDVSRPADMTRRARNAWRASVQLVFQDPYSSLNPALTIRSTLAEAVARRADRPADADAEVTALLGLVGLPAGYADRLPRALSGGERQRVAIARAVAVRPRLLICDEPVSALDVSVQAEILRLFRRLQHELAIAYLFITHDLAVLRQVAERAYVMHRGRVVEEGPVETLLDAPSHPYTRRLVASTPRAHHQWLLADGDAVGEERTQSA